VGVYTPTNRSTFMSTGEFVGVYTPTNRSTDWSTRMGLWGCTPPPIGRPTGRHEGGEGFGGGVHPPRTVGVYTPTEWSTLGRPGFCPPVWGGGTVPPYGGTVERTRKCSFRGFV